MTAKLDGLRRLFTDLGARINPNIVINETSRGNTAIALRYYATDFTGKGTMESNATILLAAVNGQQVDTFTKLLDYKLKYGVYSRGCINEDAEQQIANAVKNSPAMSEAFSLHQLAVEQAIVDYFAHYGLEYRRA